MQTESEFHKKYQYGISYPNNIRGVGSPADLLAFFEAICLVSSNPREEFPLTLLLGSRPIYGGDMLLLFEEMRQLEVRFERVTTSKTILSCLGLLNRQTKLKTKEASLSGIFSRIFYIIIERASNFLNILSEDPDDDTLEWGSIRIGPIEPIIPASLFQQLPASAFDDSDPPLWLRDEIFDEEFYKGKI